MVPELRYAPPKAVALTARRPLRGLRTLGVAGAVLLVAACAPVGPNYVRPAVPVPAGYKEARLQGSTPGVSTAVPSAGKWWSIYNDPTLDALVSQVAVSNQTLAASAARVAEAGALVRVAGGEQYPQVGVGSIKSGKRNRNDFGLGVTWELDLWGRVRRDVEAHRATASASAYDLAGATLSMQAQVVQAYFGLRQNDALIELLQHAVDVNAQSQRMVQNQFTQGVASSANVSDALARYTRTQIQLGDAKSARAQYEHALAVMLGKAPSEFSLAPAPFDTAVPVIPAGVPATLLQRRPDIAASEQRMVAANARVGVAKAEQLPTISVAAGIGILKGPTATPDIRAVLFSGGRLSAQVDNAHAGYNEAVANYRQAVLDAYREVEDGLVIAANLAGSADLQAKAAAAAVESNRVMQNQYREGVADYPAVVDASGALLDVGQADLQLRLRRLDASVNLIKALGGNWAPMPAPTAR